MRFQSAAKHSHPSQQNVRHRPSMRCQEQLQMLVIVCQHKITAILASETLNTNRKSPLPDMLLVLGEFRKHARCHISTQKAQLSWPGFRVTIELLVVALCRMTRFPQIQVVLVPVEHVFVTQ
jgi:hypothetical protein